MTVVRGIAHIYLVMPGRLKPGIDRVAASGITLTDVAPPEGPGPIGGTALQRLAVSPFCHRWADDDLHDPSEGGLGILLVLFVPEEECDQVEPIGVAGTAHAHHLALIVLGIIDQCKRLLSELR